jgi:lipid A 3-O-deacylase
MRLFAVVFLCLCALSAAGQSAVSVYATGGKSITTWHGQADLQALNFEVARPLSPRTEWAVVLAPVNLWQPRSWFGDQYRDGNEQVRALSASLLVRRRFWPDARRMQAFVEGGTGPMYATKAVPASTSRFNFATQLGAGVVLAPRARVAVVVGYRFVHISNGGYSPRNPGVNVSAVILGVRFRR